MSGNNLQVEKKGPPVNGQAKIDVPVVTSAVPLSDHTKIDLLTEKFEEILQILGLNPRRQPEGNATKNCKNVYQRNF